jgi:pimeloyl-ACP methyl ester carboxylesterase
MPYAVNPIDGARIYYEVEGNGAPLLLHHGMTSGLDSWSLFGYRETLVQNFQAIFMDARGHRMSDSPHDPAAYSQPLVVHDVLAVLDDLGVEQTHLWGYSLGGTIGIALLATEPGRLQSLVVGAAHPYRTDPVVASQAIAVHEQGAKAFVAVVERQLGPLEPANRDRILRNDFDATAAFMTARRDDPSYDEATLVKALQPARVPCLFYAGTADPVYAQVKRAAELDDRSIFLSFEEHDHIRMNWRSDLVLPPVMEFLNRVTDGGREEVQQ